MNTYIIQLAGSLLGSPSPWQIFFARELADGPKDEMGDVTEDYINEQLKKYQGQYIRDDLGWGYLKFDTEQALMIFKLKFS